MLGVHLTQLVSCAAEIVGAIQQSRLYSRRTRVEIGILTVKGPKYRPVFMHRLIIDVTVPAAKRSKHENEVYLT